MHGNGCGRGRQAGATSSRLHWGGPQSPVDRSADKPSVFCHQSHQEPAQPTRTPADPTDFHPTDLNNFSPKKTANDQQVRKMCSRSGECKLQLQRAVTSHVSEWLSSERQEVTSVSDGSFNDDVGILREVMRVTSAPFLMLGTSCRPVSARLASRCRDSVETAEPNSHVGVNRDFGSVTIYVGTSCHLPLGDRGNLLS